MFEIDLEISNFQHKYLSEYELLNYYATFLMENIFMKQKYA